MFDARTTDPVDTARHAAAGRAATLGAATTATCALAITFATALSGTIATSPTMAIGTTIAITGAPFAGALAGFSIAMHRWSSLPVTLHARHGASRHPVYVAVRRVKPRARPAERDALPEDIDQERELQST